MMQAMLGALIAVLTLVGMTSHVHAYPDKPVRLIVPYPAGGSADLPARILAEGLQRKLGKPFIVENRVGAAGAIGAEAVTRAAPDGYTLYCGPNAPLVLLPLIRALPYKPSDLVPIAPYGEVVYGFGVLASMKVNNLKELQALAGANPGKFFYSSPGSGSATNLRGEAFKAAAGVDITHLPYRTGAEAIPDLLGGRLDIMLDNIFFPQVRQGTVKLLGVLSNRRHPEFPDVPTFAEQGFQGFDIDSWLGVYAPAKLPQPVVEAWTAALRDITRMPDVTAKLVAFGLEPLVNTPAQFAEAFKADYPRVAELIKAAGVTAE